MYAWIVDLLRFLSKDSYSFIGLRCFSDDIEISIAIGDRSYLVSLDIVVWVGIRLDLLVNSYFI